MADENQEEVQEEAKGGIGKLLVPILIGVVCLAGGAGGAFFFLGGSSEPVAEGSAEGEGGEGEAAAEEPDDLAERLVSLEPFVVNLGDGGRARYLKVKLELELDEADAKVVVEESVPLLRDAIIVLLSSQRLADLQEFEGKVLLKEELLDRVNGSLETASVQSVLFTEFVIQ